MTAQEFLNRLEILGECAGRTDVVMILPIHAGQVKTIVPYLKGMNEQLSATAQDVKDFVDSIKKLQTPQLPPLNEGQN